MAVWETLAAMAESVVSTFLCFIMKLEILLCARKKIQQSLGTVGLESSIFSQWNRFYFQSKLKKIKKVSSGISC